MTDQRLEKWHHAVINNDSEVLSELLHDDVTFHSPTVWKPKRRTGHVGIMASSSGIYSNSSTRRKWMRNYTVRSWTAYYGRRKGLKVNYYKILR